MGAIIIGADGSSALTIDPTSLAARATLFDASGREVATKPTGGSYLAHILIRQAAATTAGNVVWSLWNTSTTLMLRVRSMVWTQLYDGGATAAGITYGWFKTSSITTTAPTGGTAIVPTKKRSADGAATADVRFLATGLTLGSVTLATDPFFRMNLSANVPTRWENYSLLARLPFTRNGEIEVGPREGVAMAIVTGATTAGSGLAGYVEWDETAL